MHVGGTTYDALSIGCLLIVKGCGVWNHTRTDINDRVLGRLGCTASAVKIGVRPWLLLWVHEELPS